MLVCQAYRFGLDPNDRVRSALASHAGGARFAYNRVSGWSSMHMAARKALIALGVRQGAVRRKPKPGLTLCSARCRGRLPGAAAGVEPGQGRGGPVVGRELEGVLLLGPRRAGPWSCRLVRSLAGGARGGRPAGFPRSKAKRFDAASG